MKLLAIETSCDETGIAVVEARGPLGDITEKAPIKVLSDLLVSQIDIHKEYGGVFPAVARREHRKAILPLLLQALETAELLERLSSPREFTPTELEKLHIIFHKEPELLEQVKEILPQYKNPDIDAIAVTSGPGLEPALWVGITTAQALGILWGKPVIPVNHMEGHIMASLLAPGDAQNPKALTLTAPEYPSLALLISGGHTELVLMPEAGVYKILGQTRDDAVGEAFDKVARMLGLSYPGGPEISRLAEQAIGAPLYPLPRPMLKSGDYDFSFSGLKTAVLYTIKNIQKVPLLEAARAHSENPPLMGLTAEIKSSIAKEFEDAVTEILVAKTMRAAEEYNVCEIILGGGVTANKKIRATFQSVIAENRPDIKLFIPPYKFSTDNGLMIAIAGLFHLHEPHTAIRAEGTMRLSKE